VTRVSVSWSGAMGELGLRSDWAAISKWLGLGAAT
jgi:hypothetical protein